MRKLEHMTEPELAELMRAMAQTVEKVARRRAIEKPLFALLVWNDPKVGQYVCNCTRAGAIDALRETADRLEWRQDVARSEAERLR